MTTTSRTHCHFVMQARALRVPEVCVHISVPTHIAASFCISLWCLRLSISVLRWRLSTGTNELNHSYYTGTALSTLHSSHLGHDDTVSTSVIPLVSTQETNGTTSSGSAFGPQLHTAPSAHLFLRAPLATSQAKQCQLRSPRLSRSSHSLSSYSAATS